MFTGIVEEVGAVEALESRPAGARLRLACRKVLGDLQHGGSVAVNGVCLTAVDIGPQGFAADVAPETLSRTNLGALRQGSLVNLERPLSPSGRLDGHIVQGHVDGTGEFLGLEPLGGENWWLQIRVPPELDRYVVSKGSIAVDGISLTVASIEGDVLSVAVIPTTFRGTSLQGYRRGARVNLECDILAKYVEKMLGAFEKPSRLTTERLRDLGY